MYMVTSPCSRYDTELADEAATLIELPRVASSATSVTTLPCRFMSSSLSVSRCIYESIAALPRPMLSFVPRRNRFQCAFGAVGSRTPGIVRLADGQRAYTLTRTRCRFVCVTLVSGTVMSQWRAHGASLWYLAGRFSLARPRRR